MAHHYRLLVAEGLAAVLLMQANLSDKELAFLQSVDTEHGINGINKLPT